MGPPTRRRLRGEPGIPEPCDKPEHRPHDWRLRPDPELGPGPIVCGICHPPAPSADEVLRRGDPGFEA